MDWLFLRGIVIGFAIAAPVGPIGVLVIRQTLAHGRRTGLVTGLGAATADACYGCVGAFGVSFVTNALLGEQHWIALLGGGFLCFLGIRTLLATPAEHPATSTTTTDAQAYLSTFVLTLTNPATIIAFAAIFASLGVGTAGSDYSAAALLVGGVFCGSALWWLVLSSGVGMLRGRLTPARLRWVNWASGAVLVVFGLAALASALG